ncbi:hypothetical protein B0H63DRAFT_516441 [Podospora didyma]|uniref:BTB domain-containing protein n=1 Tax=Podospora didyma TaxID=330526 RepID=A0AAE0U6X4_9PEZI|nr:hypothetical protein B0H63DRAFT_516441 [Podospora didyma]
MTEVELKEFGLGGNIELVVGRSGAQKKFRVHADILSAASPVFGRMLGPHFLEGRLLRRDGHVQIPLPDDRVEALEEAASVCHQIAVVADKWDFVAGIPEGIVRNWLAGVREMLEHHASFHRECFRLVLAADLSSMPKEFALAAKMLIFNAPSSFVQLGRDHARDNDPHDIVWPLTGIERTTATNDY